MQVYSLGHLAGLRLSARPSALLAVVVLWGVFSAGALALGTSPGAALGWGLVAVALHWVAELWHQLGHAWAARRTGHPMIGIQFWGPLSASVYPAHEPPLPGPVHIRRALGGPLASALLALIAGLGAFALPPGSVAAGLALFIFGENLLVFTLGALLPLGFNDGTTLVQWWGKP
jgi:hypothetical protein